MPTKKEYEEFISEQLSELGNIAFKPMMGEFLLYFNGVLVGGIYDDRLLIKKTKGNASYGMSEELPYRGGKPMLKADCVDEKEKLQEIIVTTYEDLSNNKKVVKC